MNEQTRQVAQLHAMLLTHFEDKELYNKDEHLFVNADYWTLADLIVRQWLNNGADGFGMNNTAEGYEFVRNHRNELRDLNMLSEEGRNNSGMPLWTNWEV